MEALQAHSSRFGAMACKEGEASALVLVSRGSLRILPEEATDLLEATHTPGERSTVFKQGTGTGNGQRFNTLIVFSIHGFIGAILVNCCYCLILHQTGTTLERRGWSGMDPRNEIIGKTQCGAGQCLIYGPDTAAHLLLVDRARAGEVVPLLVNDCVGRHSRRRHAQHGLTMEGTKHNCTHGQP